VSKGVEDGCRLPALRAATPQTDVRLFQGWPPEGRRRVRHGRLLRDLFVHTYYIKGVHDRPMPYHFDCETQLVAMDSKELSVTLYIMNF
jgi:hypothetical protein